MLTTSAVGTVALVSRVLKLRNGDPPRFCAVAQWRRRQKLPLKRVALRVSYTSLHNDFVRTRLRKIKQRGYEVRALER